MRLRILTALLLVVSTSVTPSGLLGAARTDLDVPIVTQAHERCGQAALEMVLRYYGADSTALREPGRAYDPVLRGALITDLATAARRAGFDARIAALSPDSLVALIAEGVPPIVLYQNGRPPVTVPHYGVITAWDAARGRFTLNEGRAKPRTMGRADLERRWRTAGWQALIVRRGAP